MAPKILPNQAHLREIFDYDPDTGSVVWRKPPRRRDMVGQHAGYISRQGYLRLHVSGSPFMAHRVVWKWMTDEEPPSHIDHINGNTIDNRWANLRAVTASQSMQNRRIKSHNNTGYKGVYRTKGNRWFWTKVNGVRVSGFKTAEEAHEKYCEMARAAYGEYFRSS